MSRRCRCSWRRFSLIALVVVSSANNIHAFSVSSTTSKTSSSTNASEKKTAGSNDNKWKPKISSLEERRLLRGKVHDTERIGSLGFHHVEFYCGDAKSTAYQFSMALGMPITGMSGQITGNDQCISYGLESGNVRLLMTAPYSTTTKTTAESISSSLSSLDDSYTAPNPLPSFDSHDAHEFFQKHGLAAKAVGLEVKCAKESFKNAVSNGATPKLEPTFIPTCNGQKDKFGGVLSSSKGCTMSEVELYDDVVLRFISFDNTNDDADNDDTSITQQQQQDNDEDINRNNNIPFLPNLAPMEGEIATKQTFGIYKIDHAVGNVPNLLQALNRISGYTGYHEFAEFTSEDVGTIDSGLNSVVLASDTEDVLLPLNEPTEGKRKSQIQTYLEQNEGAGLQHLALKTNDIFKTITEMRNIYENSYGCCGFDLMKRPSKEYYNELPERLGDKLSDEQYQKLEDLGILADADDEGILLQIFTKPIGDRPTFFIEIIQRIGCVINDEDDDNNKTASEEEAKEEGEDTTIRQEIKERPGCGGFGQGNFKELFKAIEDHEKMLKV